MYVIIDLETTGGKFNEEGITEVAIYKFDGHEIVDQFITLVNPERPIQPFVVQLTGITENMVRTAPKFYEIAKRIIEITQDCVFIAHNTSFDYRVMRTEFNRLGYEYVRETLCTVELSKKLIPDQPSYSLGKLCRAIGIPMSDRHRASGDAMATVKLFKLLLTKDIDKEITKSSIKIIEDPRKIISNKLLKILDATPTVMGLYYIHDVDGNVIYAGKNKNIKKGINQLFLRTSNKIKKLQDATHSISHEITGNELFMQLRYNAVIGNKKPKFNNVIKKETSEIIFNTENMLVIDKGRNVSEKAILLIENNQILGIGYVDLSHQIEHIEIIKNLITPIKDTQTNRALIKKYLLKGHVERIVRYEL